MFDIIRNAVACRLKKFDIEWKTSNARSRLKEQRVILMEWKRRRVRVSPVQED